MPSDPDEKDNKGQLELVQISTQHSMDLDADRDLFAPKPQKLDTKIVKIGLQLYTTSTKSGGIGGGPGSFGSGGGPGSFGSSSINSNAQQTFPGLRLGPSPGNLQSMSQTSRLQLNKYVLDIQKLMGEMFPFMDLCAKILAQLQSLQSLQRIEKL